MSRDTDVLDVIAKLNELMGALRENVTEINAVLTSPEVPDGDAA